MSKEKFKQLMTEEKSGGPALTDQAVKRFFKEISAELKDQVAFGAHELASVLFTGAAYVQYAREGKEDEGHGLPEQAKELDRGGRE
jgi:hypothetical protein